MSEAKEAKGSVPDTYPKVQIPEAMRAPLLRPLRGYLWDTEALVAGKSELRFFQRPQGWQMMHCNNKKTEFDTNMLTAHSVTEPEQFQIFGVHVSTTPMEPAARERLFFDARISFYMNSESYFSGMLSDVIVAEKSKRQWYEAVERHLNREKEETKATEEQKVDDELSLRYMKECLNLGRYAIQIRPESRFYWEIKWSKPVQVEPLFRVAMYGIRYVPVGKVD